MSWVRAKPPEQVRADALQMARRKQRDGCSPCAQAYIDLARRHGASREEVEQALRPGPPSLDDQPG